MLTLTSKVIDEKYRIEKLLGQGGMGAVYKATHLGTKRPVAVKIIVPDYMANEEYVERFKREAQAAGKLQHPNVVNVTDFGIANLDSNQFAYLVMEYLPGETLKDLIVRSKQLPTSLIIDILEQIALAIDAAHKAGITHRDLKPANIWLQPNGRGGYIVKVLDFGLAKVAPDFAKSLTVAKLPTSYLQNIPNIEKILGIVNNKSTSSSSVATLLNQTLTMGSEAFKELDNVLEEETKIKQPQNIENTEDTLPIGSQSSSPKATFIQTLTMGSGELNLDSTKIKYIKNQEDSHDVDSTLLIKSEKKVGKTTDENLAIATNQILEENTQEDNPANTLKAEATLTRIGEILGTPHYMSPEQCGSNIKDVDYRSDIYSLGLIAYEMFSGQKPFSGNMYQLIYKHAEEYPEAIRKVRKDIPKSVDRLILWAIDKNKLNRPKSAGSWALALKTALEADKPLIEEAKKVYQENYFSFVGFGASLYLPIVLGFFWLGAENIVRSSVLLSLGFFFAASLANRLMLVGYSLLITSTEQNRKTSIFSLLRKSISFVPSLAVLSLQIALNKAKSLITNIKNKKLTLNLGEYYLYPIVLLEGKSKDKVLEKSKQLAEKASNIRAFYFYDLASILLSTLIVSIVNPQLPPTFSNKPAYILVFSILQLMLFLVSMSPLLILSLQPIYTIGAILAYKNGCKILGDIALTEIKTSYQNTIPSFNIYRNSIAKFLFNNGLRQLIAMGIAIVIIIAYGLMDPQDRVVNAIGSGETSQLSNLVKKADINRPNFLGEIPLVKAVRFRNVEAVKILIDNKANVNVININGQSPLNTAAELQDLEILKLLLKANANINIKDEKGNTPLIWAVWKKNVAMTSFLLSLNPDVNIKNSSGKTALDYAREHKDPDILALFQLSEMCQNNNQ